MYHLLAKLHHVQSDVFNFRWIDHVKNIIDNTGFSEIWYAESGDTEKFKSCFKQRCVYIYKQDWCSEVQNNCQCTIYKIFKETHEFENYVTWNHLIDMQSANFALAPITYLLPRIDSKHRTLVTMPFAHFVLRMRWEMNCIMYLNTHISPKNEKNSFPNICSNVIQKWP